jgi:maltose/moltooligosaccharide transporter
MGLISLGAIAQNTWTNIITNKYLLLLSMLGVGIVWASVLAMPYAIAEVELSEDTVMET